MYHQHCYHALDYASVIRSFADARVLSSVDRVIQFPFAVILVEEKSKEDLDRIAEKKKESGKRLQEQAQRQRLEKVSCRSGCRGGMLVETWFTDEVLATS